MDLERAMEKWMSDNKDEIAQAQAFSVADLPDEPGKMALDLSRSNRECARMGYLLSEAEAFHNRAKEAALKAARDTYPKLRVEERKIIALADPLYLTAMGIRDVLKVIVHALKDRSFSLMNLRRTTYMPSMSEHD